MPILGGSVPMISYPSDPSQAGPPESLHAGTPYALQIRFRTGIPDEENRHPSKSIPPRSPRLGGEGLTETTSNCGAGRAKAAEMAKIAGTSTQLERITDKTIRLVTALNCFAAT